MRIRSGLAAAAAIVVAFGVAGCNDADAPGTTVSVTAPTVAESTSAAPASANPPVRNSVPAQPASSSAQPPAAAQPPDGSGHGLCFDINSKLANDSVKRLSGGPWKVDDGSNDPISAGCGGVLSWMTVENGGIHPLSHILFFTGGSYLGTATSQPYAYTQVSRQSANVVVAQYHWPLDGDALCCPQGSSTVTFTLTGTTVHADGQFPPN